MKLNKGLKRSNTGVTRRALIKGIAGIGVLTAGSTLNSAYSMTPSKESHSGKGISSMKITKVETITTGVNIYVKIVCI